ncbi:hypothetical protein AB0F16_14640 [Streptomyces tanashiensis]|uniref:hypothetical protein n=1 Tax=Streptomyces tanashiensis TaxID=67367 RepID=UPI0033D26DDF
MIRPVEGPPTWKHLMSALAIIALIAAVWYGMQPVYSPCVYFGNHSYEKAVEYGQCDPPKTRFSTWTQ